MDENIERRTFPVSELRVAGEADAPTIEGHAAVFNSPSEDMGFTEIIEPGFFEKVLGDDVRALWNHDSNIVLGRTRSNTLKVEEDSTGLHTVITPPTTALVNDMVLTPMRRGDVNQMSFAFSVGIDGDAWTKVGEKIIRTLKRGGCARLYDVSPVTYPAYPETSVAVRSKLKELRAEPQPSAGQEPGADAEAEQAQKRVQTRKRLLDLTEEL